MAAVSIPAESPLPTTERHSDVFDKILRSSERDLNVDSIHTPSCSYQKNLKEVSRILKGDRKAPHEDYEPSDSGRTRSSARRLKAQEADKSSDSNKAANESSSTTENKGRKRKRVSQGNGDGSDSDPDEGADKSRARTCSDDATNGLKDEAAESQVEQPVCTCPKNVMKCIGILPSLDIVNYFCDSDSSDSSANDDIYHTVLPTVSREHHSQS